MNEEEFKEIEDKRVTIHTQRWRKRRISTNNWE